MSWHDAESYAQSLGGHLVTVNDQAEMNWLLSRFGTVFWLGLNDVQEEGTFVWTSGEPVEYTRWAWSHPESPYSSSSQEKDYVLMSMSTSWHAEYDGWFNVEVGSYAGVIEIANSGAADTDGDGLPDTLDWLPEDPLNGFDLREAGDDGTFGTSDDNVYSVWTTYDGGTQVKVTLWDGPLAPGSYQLRVTKSVTDAVTNPLDGDGDGTGGDDFVRRFTVAEPLPWLKFEGHDNRTRDTATPLTLVQDPHIESFFAAEFHGTGSNDPASDVDFWSFEGRAGDSVILHAVTEAGDEVQLGLMDEYYFTSEQDRLRKDGSYFVPVHGIQGDYELYVYVTSGLPIGQASGQLGLPWTQDGVHRKSSAWGLLTDVVDDHAFNLGQLNAGNTIELQVQLPQNSSLAPTLLVEDSSGNAIADEDGDPLDAHFLATLTADGLYRTAVYSQLVRNGHRYIVTDEMTWPDAQAYAESLGGYLVSINDQDEQNWVLENFPHGRLWIGLSDAETEGDWSTWRDGTAVEYTNWDDGEPTGYDYAYLDHWQDTWRVTPWYYSNGKTFALIEIPDAGGFADGAGPGPRGTYVLDVDVSDTIPPRIESVEKLPDSGQTDLHIRTFDVSFSEPMTLAAPDFTVHNGHFYFSTDETMTWPDAEALAQSMGGHLVTVNDQVEMDWLLSTFGSGQTNFWIGLNDIDNEGTYVWSSGEPVTYTNWAYQEPDNEEDADGVYAYYNTGQWTDFRQDVKAHGVIEVDGNQDDTDGDGVPNVIDPWRNDPYNGWDLRGAGSDGLFDTNDDIPYALTIFNTTVEVAEGPIQPGLHRLIVTTSNTDKVGNPLDADGDGVGGDNYVRTFTIAEPPPGYVFEPLGIHSLDSAASLLLLEDPRGSGLFIARAQGSIDPGSDEDYWSLEARAGDRVTVLTESLINTRTYLYDASGTVVASDHDGGPWRDDYISYYTVPDDGTYALRVRGRYSNYIGEYAVHVAVARGLESESDREYANDTLASAEAVNYVIDGTQRAATVTGMVMADDNGKADEDVFSLGTIEAGQTILAGTRLPTSSHLRPVVDIRDSGNLAISIGANPSDAVARADITETGEYFAVMRGAGGAGGHGQYLLDVIVLPTSELDFPDLAVQAINAPASATSGALIPLTWTVGNFGVAATSVGNWSDRLVLSANDRYGDGDDMPLQVVPHSGALDAAQTYTATVDVRLPVGLEGNYWVFVQVDSGNDVPEFIFEQNNTGLTLQPLPVTLTDYADLQAADATTSGDLFFTGAPLQIDWQVSNVGPGTTGDGTPGGTVEAWADRIVLSADTLFSGDDVFLAEIAHDGALAAMESYSASWPGTVPAGVTGAFFVLVITDYGEDYGQVYEHANQASNIAVSSTVIRVAEEPFSDLKATWDDAPNESDIGGAIEVAWSVRNTTDAWSGTPVGDWYDRIVLSRDTVYGNADDRILASIPHKGILPVDTGYHETATVTLPTDFSGDGYLMVVADSRDQIYEFLYEDNNATAGREIHVFAPDLTADVQLDTFRAFFGDTIGIDLAVTNRGDGPATQPFQDRIWLSGDTTLGGDTLLATTTALAGPLAAGESRHQDDILVNLPLFETLPPGDYYLIVQTDAFSHQPESDESNNAGVTAVPIQLSLPPLPDLRVEFLRVVEDDLTSSGPLTITWKTVNGGHRSIADPFYEQVVVTNLTTRQTLVDTAVPLHASAQDPVEIGEAVARQYDFIMPDGLAGVGDLLIGVTTDAGSQIVESHAGQTPETNNSDTINDSSRLKRYPDLQISSAGVLPASVQTGQTVTVHWRLENTGDGDVDTKFQERIRVVHDTTDELLVGAAVTYDPATEGVIAAGGGIDRTQVIAIPHGSGAVGEFTVTIATDAEDDLYEFNSLGDAQVNNAAATMLSVTLAPYPDLVTTSVTAPAQTIADPARVTVQWTVENAGTLDAADAWHDVIVASENLTLGDGDDVKLAQFKRTSDLAVGGTYTRSESVVLPPAFSGRYYLYVRADGLENVFEDGREENNVARSPDFFDVMVIPYADLVVTNVNVPATASSGQSIAVSWRVENQGLGLTDIGRWSEWIYLASDPEGNDPVVTFGYPAHYGQLAVGAGYERTVNYRLPDGLEGTFYIVVATGGPFEFVHTDNNRRISNALEVQLTPPPDLIVTDIVAPTETIVEGTSIDVQWTVANVGEGDARGSWVDKVYLRKVGNPNAPTISVGTFRYDATLPAGTSYTRLEQVRLPERTYGSYEAVVVTNYTASLYEHVAHNNNTAVDDIPVPIAIRPRPDVRVLDITVPAVVDPGQTIALAFTVTNQGNAATDGARWKDKVYLSLDAQISGDDILVGTLTNQSALEPGESYQTWTESAVIPLRFRGTAYLIVRTDAESQLDEWPHDNDNTEYYEFYVTPQPLPDLVTGEVVAPVQAIEGATIEVRYTVTNLGPGITPIGSWSDTIWLAEDKNRPHPGQGDRRLKTVNHSGYLENGAGYDVVTMVELPTGLVSGTYYITPWTDTYDVVLEDTLAVNVNPDDPNEQNNNNYKARSIDILALNSPDPEIVKIVAPTLPDLQVSEVTATPTPTAFGGDQFTVTWTTINAGQGDAKGGWTDTVWLREHPDGTGKGLYLGSRGNGDLRSGEQYTSSLTVLLSPSARGSSVVVKTDAAWDVRETDEYNNEGLGTTDVDPVPADLVVTGVEVSANNRSGELATIRYTVENQGEHTLWPGTEYWTDHLWISADATFIKGRVSYFGKAIHSHAQSLAPGEGYTEEVTAELPKGIGGEFFVYVLTDTHGPGDGVRTAWWPADDGSNPDLGKYLTNADWLKYLRHWAFEYPFNNVFRADLPVDYFEPDLVISGLQIPPDAVSGQTFDVAYTVTNEGTRDTREDVWTDRFFLSRDPSLDQQDLQFGEFQRRGLLAIGDSYTHTASVSLPHGIEGSFYVIAIADSPASDDRSRNSRSNIGFGNYGVRFESRRSEGGVWAKQRSLAWGTVAEYQLEGNNTAVAPQSVARTALPDLQVTEITAPERVRAGQRFEISYTVTNQGGDTLPIQSGWEDHVYLSRDEFLDLRADQYMTGHGHNGGLVSGESYTVTKTLRAPADFFDETEEYYVFVVTDPLRNSSFGRVYEAGQERNNDRHSDVPVIIELPPPTDLQVAVVVPDAAVTGEPISVSWTVTNASASESASGAWWDTAYLSTDATWDIDDMPIGRGSFEGTLAPGQTYTRSLTALAPPATPGQYHVIVRTDIFNQIYEETFDANNKTASAEPIDVTAVELALGVPYETTLSSDQQRLFQVTVPHERTLRISLTTDADEAANELFVRYDQAPTMAYYDAAYEGGLAADVEAFIPDTEPGVYYVLVRGYREPADDTPVTLLAELMPLAITRVATDAGGDSKYVTTTIRGAQFAPDAIVKLIRPGFAEYEPQVYEVIDSTKIIATFDFTGAPHGLYDLKVINPGGDAAVIPYRFLIERAIEPDVTIGLGGPRTILAGDLGNYSVALQNLSNLDAPYTFFQAGIPELGANDGVYGLPFLRLNTNVQGSPDGRDDIAWATIDSRVNPPPHGGYVLAPGYLFDLDANGFTGFSFNVSTYPGLQEIHDGDPEQPTECEVPFIPFHFYLAATSTAMTREEFVVHAANEAETLRQAIIQDDAATPALLALAADSPGWVELFLAALEEGGVLRSDGATPPIREQENIISLMTTLSSGILIGPAGQEITSSGSLLEFFEQVRVWYGHNSSRMTPDAEWEKRRSRCYVEDIPLPTAPDYEQWDLGLSQPTHFEAFRVYVPWIPFEKRGGGLPAEYQITGPYVPDNAEEVHPLDLTQYLQDEAVAGLASMTGPQTVDTEGWLPVGQRLPYTIGFENSSDASRYVQEVRIVTPLDEEADVFSFQLGDIKIGKINVHLPTGRALFQGEFDFVDTEGFLLRVSAGVDQFSHEATWLLQAIDPLTGELIQDPNRGILPPNNAQAEGAGFVAYTVMPDTRVVETGAELTASARVLFNDAPPEDTPEISQTIDVMAPATELTVERVAAGSDNYLVSWNVTDDPGGSGFRHVTLYAATDGGDYRIWQRQLDEAAGTMVYEGQPGHTYEFLALPTDVAGNRARPSAAVTAEDDGTRTNLGAPASVPETTAPNFGIAPEPTAEPSTNPLFAAAEEQIPAALPSYQSPEFDLVLRPFTAQAFVRGVEQSHADIGPMAIVEVGHVSNVPESSPQFLVSGGPGRNLLYKFDATGGEALESWAEVPHPIFNLAFDPQGRLWATTGGGPLLELDPDTGEIIDQHGDGITTALAVHPQTGELYVAAGAVWSGGVAGVGGGVEIFDPVTETFRHFSRDLNLRVASLAFQRDGTLWATTWPDRRQVVRFTDQRRAELMFEFDAAVDSVAFGQAGTQLDGLLFVSHNEGANEHSGSELTMVDLATLRRVTLADGGSRGDVVVTTSDGRLLISQSEQVDVLNPVSAPVVIATYPPPDSVIALPMSYLAVTFDQEMFVGAGAELNSAINTDNYRLIGRATGEIDLATAFYEGDDNSVLLPLEWLEPDKYEVIVRQAVSGVAGMTMEADYSFSFTAVSDFSELVDIQFATSRSDRATQTVSWDVIVTNNSDRDLLLPLILILDPADGYEGLPVGAGSQAPDGRWFIDVSEHLPDGLQLGIGQSTTGRTVSIYNQDDRRVDYATAVGALPAANQRPVFDTDPLSVASVGQPYAYDADAHDPDDGPVYFFLQRGPEDMVVDPITGQINWTPAEFAKAQAPVVLHVYDEHGGRAEQAFVIDVAGGNQAPVLGAIPSLVRGVEGQPIELQLPVFDPDDDSLAAWGDNLPPGAAFDPIGLIFTWTPDFASAGTYRDVVFHFSDGTNHVTSVIEFAIAPTDQPPQLLPPPDRTVREGDRVQFYLRGFDPDGEAVTFHAPVLPPGARLDPDTGFFEWNVDYYQSGQFELDFTVSNEDGSATKSAAFTVINANGAPVFDELLGWRVYEGQLVAFTAFAYDPDNPAYEPPVRGADEELVPVSWDEPSVTYTVAGLPEGATFDAETTLFTWVPDYDDGATHRITFTATDDGDGTGVPLAVSTTVELIVMNQNRAPEIQPFDHQVIPRDVVTDLPITVTDPDGDPITLTAESAMPGFALPDFLTLIDNGDGTGLFRFAPTADHRGDYGVTLLASDDGGGEAWARQAASFTFVITVDVPNETPIFDYIGNRVAVVGEPLELTIRARDADQEPLAFQMTGLPPEATLRERLAYGTATLYWTPQVENAGTRGVTFTVTDGGNGGLAAPASDAATIGLTVREANTSPYLPWVPDQTIDEGGLLEFAFDATDADGDALTYSGDNLPLGATIDPAIGRFSWTPGMNQAGLYEDVRVVVTDGHRSRFDVFSIEVAPTNRPPHIVPQLPLFGSETLELSFTIEAGDADGDALIFTAEGLPDGAQLDGTTGDFRWTPGYEDAGDHTVRLIATDTSGLSDATDVLLHIDNVNRPPVIDTSYHSVRLGDELRFFVDATDPDAGTTLAYSAACLPEGATVDPATGEFVWAPGPGQQGEYVVRLEAGDGEATSSQAVVILAAIELPAPAVTIELTPSFPALPGAPVLVHAIADSLADIVELIVTFDGVELELDSYGRAEIVAPDPGKYVVQATATDADGLVGTAINVLKVRKLDDQDAPVVELAAAKAGPLIPDGAIAGTVRDENLDSWTLQMRLLGEDQFHVIASGDAPIENGLLTQLDVQDMPNGFYQLRLTAQDIGRRIARTEAIVEVRSDEKRSFQLTETDLSVVLAGVGVDVARAYDSTRRDVEGKLGYGWRLAGREVDFRAGVRETGHEAQGLYLPYREGTRVYLATPDGQDAGFTFRARRHVEPGVVYYTPVWKPIDGDAGGWTLRTEDQRLMRGGDLFFEHATGRPYNPLSPFFEGVDFVLTSPTGVRYGVDAALGIVSQTNTEGQTVYVGDSGIVATSGEAVQFMYDGHGRISRILAPDGTALVYRYDADGNLVSVRQPGTGDTQRFGYDGTDLHLLRSVVQTGGAGTAVLYSADQPPSTAPIEADLGASDTFTGQVTLGSLSPGETDRFTFSVRDSEILSTATGEVLARVVVQTTNGDLEPTVPELVGVPPRVSYADGSRAEGLFAVDRESLYQIAVACLPDTSGAYDLQIFVAGDINADGTIDGLDSQLMAEAQGASFGEPGYDLAADLDGSGMIDRTDSQILIRNYGFVANAAPRINVPLPKELTHVDLATHIPLASVMLDPDGDPTFYRIVGAEHGQAELTVDGTSALFRPEPGYVGQASIQVSADDGFNTSPIATIPIDVSDAALLRIDFSERTPHLETGERRGLRVVGDFEDQTSVPLIGDYVSFATMAPSIATVGENGVLQGLDEGFTIATANRDDLQAATAVTVGDPDDPPGLTEEGLSVYPSALSLPLTDGQRQFLVTSGDNDLAGTVSGTVYVIGDRRVSDVTPDGLVTSVGAGETTLTILHGPVETVVPILADTPQIGYVQLNEAGGVIAALDGTTIAIPPGALGDDVIVSIVSTTEAELPIPVPEPFTYGASFELDLGDAQLAEPAQVAVPVDPAELSAGDDVYFFERMSLAYADGMLRDWWIMIEVGQVDENGIARTTSPPYPGFSRHGQYLCARMDDPDLAVVIHLTVAPPPTVLSYGFVGPDYYYGIDLGFLGAPIPVPADGDTIDVTAAYYGFGVTDEPPYHQQKITVDAPIAGERYMVELDAPPSASPVIADLEVMEDGTTTNLKIRGRWPASQTTQVVFKYATGETVVPPWALSNTEVAVRVPVSVVLGLTDVMVQYPTEWKDGKRDPVGYARSNAARLKPTDSLAVTGLPLQGVAVFDTNVLPLEPGESAASGIRKLEISGDGGSTPVMTPDGTRAYVTTISDGIAVVDTIALRQVDVKPEPPNSGKTEMDTLRIAGQPYIREMVIDPAGNFLFVMGPGDKVYVIDIRPHSKWFHQKIITIKLPRTRYPMSGIAVSADGRYLYVGDSDDTSHGYIDVFDIMPENDPANLPPTQGASAEPVLHPKWGRRIHPYTMVLDQPTRAIIASSHPDRLAFLYRYPLRSVALWKENHFVAGMYRFGTITMTEKGPLVDHVNTKIGPISPLDRHYSGYHLGVQSPWDIAFTPDLKYAFLADVQTTVVSGYPGQRGDKVGVVQNPFGLDGEPKLVGSTTPIELGRSFDLAISNDGTTLFTSYRGARETLAMDVQQVIHAVETTPSDTLERIPIDQIPEFGIHIRPLSVGLMGETTVVPYPERFRFEYATMLEFEENGKQESYFVVAYELSEDLDGPFEIAFFESDDEILETDLDTKRSTFRVTGKFDDPDIVAIDDKGEMTDFSELLKKGRHRLRIDVDEALGDAPFSPNYLVASTADVQQLKEPPYEYASGRDFTPLRPEGIDRWWATAGVDETIDVTWTVYVPEKHEYRLSLGATGWDFTSGTFSITQVGQGFQGTHEYGWNKTTEYVGVLEPGLYQFLVTGIEVPDDPIVSNGGFGLWRPSDRTKGEILPIAGVVGISAFFIADHEEPTFDPILIEGVVGRLFGPEDLAEFFKPRIALEVGERFFPSSVEFLFDEVSPANEANLVFRTGQKNAVIDLSKFAETGVPSAQVMRDNATVYASVLENSELGEIAITYLFLYPRSNWKEHEGFNTHEGDTEGITVFLEKRPSGAYLPVRVGYAQHILIDLWIDTPGQPKENPRATFQRRRQHCLQSSSATQPQTFRPIRRKRHPRRGARSRGHLRRNARPWRCTDDPRRAPSPTRISSGEATISWKPTSKMPSPPSPPTSPTFGESERAEEFPVAPLRRHSTAHTTSRPGGRKPPRPATD